MFARTTDNKQLYYEVHGKAGSERTIIFLNGLTQSTMAWHLFLPYFRENHRIILLDFIFQGKSEKTGEWRDFDRHARDLSSLMDHLEITSSVICGISYGSLVAQHFAVSYPPKTEKLVLLSTFAHKTPYYEAIELSWWRALEQGGYNLMLDIMLPTVLSDEYFDNPVIPVAALKKAKEGINENTEAILALMRATRERKDFRPQLRRIKCPVLIVQGEKDILFPPKMAEEAQRSIAGSRLVIISHAGHTLNLERAGRVCDEIIAFLNDGTAP